MNSEDCQFGNVLQDILDENGLTPSDLASTSGLANSTISKMMDCQPYRLTRRNVLKCIAGLAKLWAIELDRENPHLANKLLRSASLSQIDTSTSFKKRVELDDYFPEDKEVLDIIDQEKQAFKQQQRRSKPDYRTTDSRPLIGRDKAIDAVYKKLQEANRQILILTGPPGIGKTELARQVEKKAQEDEDGSFGQVCYVPLENLDTTDNENDIIPTIAKDLGLRRTKSNPKQDINSLIRYLQKKRLLLILDNCEHVAAAVRKLADKLFANCEQIKLLATSRELFYPNIKNEYEVPPLPFPREPERLWPSSPKRLVSEYIEHEQARFSPEHLLKFAAIHLFVNCAKEADEEFTLNKQNALDVVFICAALNGNPLEIKIIASHVKPPGLTKIISMLKDTTYLVHSHQR